MCVNKHWRENSSYGEQKLDPQRASGVIFFSLHIGQNLNINSVKHKVYDQHHCGLINS